MEQRTTPDLPKEVADLREDLDLLGERLDEHAIARHERLDRQLSRLSSQVVALRYDLNDCEDRLRRLESAR